MEEYRHTGWYDVECTCDGKFRRNGRKLSPCSYSTYSPSIKVKINYKAKEKAANLLIAKAWHPDYVDGCCIIPIDGNQKNIHIDNLHIATPNEFACYRAERRRNPNAGVADLSSYGLFKETPVEGLYCTIDGVFKRNNRIVPLNEKKRTKGEDGLLHIKYIDNEGELRTTTAARLVAQTWSPQNWDDNCFVQYKDGNPRNIHSDNLILVDSHKYYVNRGKILGMGNMCDFKRAMEIVELRAKEAQIALRYFQTGSLDEFNEYVKTTLEKYVWSCIETFGGSAKMKRYAVSETLSILYDWMLSNRPLTSYSLFCRKLARTYMKDKNFGIYDIPPKPIAREYVSQLNLECLCKKYRSMKIK